MLIVGKHSRLLYVSIQAIITDVSFKNFSIGERVIYYWSRICAYIVLTGFMSWATSLQFKL